MNKTLKAVFFDLDGTLLPMDEKKFTECYFGLLCKKLAPLGYEAENLVKTVWGGTKLMVKNNGELSNEQVFWNCFSTVYGENAQKHKAVFDELYVSDFKNTKAVCGENAEAKAIIAESKKAGLKIVLATNPLFPERGLLTRAAFIGLEKSDFDYISSYEISHYSKPNPNYYVELLKNNNLSANEVLFFGNSEEEDIKPATAAGIKAVKVNGEKLTLEQFLSALNNF